MWADSGRFVKNSRHSYNRPAYRFLNVPWVATHSLSKQATYQLTRVSLANAATARLPDLTWPHGGGCACTPAKNNCWFRCLQQPAKAAACSVERSVQSRGREQGGAKGFILALDQDSRQGRAPLGYNVITVFAENNSRYQGFHHSPSIHQSRLAYAIILLRPKLFVFASTRHWNITDALVNVCGETGRNSCSLVVRLLRRLGWNSWLIIWYR